MLFNKGDNLLDLFVLKNDLAPEPVLVMFQVFSPNFFCGRYRQSRVEKTHMDPTAEGRVEGTDAVCSQEENTRVVFKHPQENTDYSIPLEIASAALQEEHISLIE